MYEVDALIYPKRAGFFEPFFSGACCSVFFAEQNKGISFDHTIMNQLFKLVCSLEGKQRHTSAWKIDVEIQ